MSAETIFSDLSAAWRLLPFPVLFVLVIVAGLAWLYVEYLFTRAARAAVKRPAPLLPWVSEVVAWLMRISWWLIWVWLVLFLAITGTLIAQELTGREATPITQALLALAAAWRRSYALLVSWLPDPLAPWLSSAPSGQAILPLRRQPLR